MTARKKTGKGKSGNLTLKKETLRDLKVKRADAARGGAAAGFPTMIACPVTNGVTKANCCLIRPLDTPAKQTP